MQTSSRFNTKTISIAILIILLGVIFYFVMPVLMPFFIGAILAYLSNPLVKRLMTNGISRTIAVMIVFSSVFIGLSVLILISIPIIQKQFSSLVSLLPQIFNGTLSKLNWVTSYLGMDGAFDQDSIRNMISQHFSEPEGLAAWLWKTTLSSSKAVVGGVIDLVLIPFVTYYLLRDWDEIAEKIQKLIPNNQQYNLRNLLEDCESTLSAFIRGQLMVVLCISIFYCITLTLAGLKVGIVVGIIMGLLTILPYIGSIAGLIIASVAAFAQTGELTPLIWVLASYAVGHLLENFYLTPKFIGNKVGLHPVLVIMVILLGGTFFGVWGILLALPLTSVAMVIIKHFHASNYTKAYTAG